MSRLVAVLLAGWVAAGWGADAADFARARPIEPADEGPVQRLIVPEDVYAWTARDDLADLRVLNGEGTVLPYAVGRGATRERTTDWQPLPLFPLPRASAAGAAAAVDIELGDDGTVVAVRGGRPADGTDRAYLVDATGRDAPIDELHLRWPAARSEFVARLRVEASPDLDTWQTIVAAATVAELGTDGRRVSASRIRLPPTTTDYLRLTQIDDGTAVEIAAVEARHRLTDAPARQWKILQGEATADGFEFDSGGHYPVDRITVSLPSATHLLEARLYSRTAPRRAWQDQGMHVFYRVALDAAAGAAAPTGTAPDALRSDPVTVTPARFWRVESVADLADRPTLEIGWVPHELWFIRQGPAPYRLVYGRAGADAQAWPMGDLAAQLGAGTTLAVLPAATLGEPQTVGGRASLEAAPQPIDWRTAALWVVLLAGVALVAWLAVRVLR